MKILYIAGREESYSRTRIVQQALRMQGLEVKGIFPPDRSFKHYPRLILQGLRSARDCDVIIVGFYGQVILPFFKILTRKPILFDMYIATYDTMVNDRNRARPGSIMARIYHWLDRLCCTWSKAIVLETQDHIEDFARKFKTPIDKFHRVFLAVDERLIYPRPQRKNSDRFLVHFHGEYAPFHGVDTILRAAQLLRDESIEFQVVGRGITYNDCRELARALDLHNVQFIDPVPYEQLADLIARADVCLGIFGGNARMLRLTTNKVIESIAMHKPLITGKNQPVQELLHDRHSALLIERANPEALAKAIRELQDDASLRDKIAEEGYRVFLQHCTLEQLGKGFNKILQEMAK
ncbi:MAG TPA: glycosyltransferase [bacterium]|nr:glycosyltransferase [bacterium]